MLAKSFINFTPSPCVSFFYNQRGDSTCSPWQDFPNYDLKIFEYCWFLLCFFCLWRCCSNDNALEFIQLKCSWHSRQRSVAPELFFFLLKLPCWCFMVLVITFFLDRALQAQPNWYTPAKLFGDSFNLFLHIKFFIFRPKVKIFFMQNFIKLFS